MSSPLATGSSGAAGASGASSCSGSSSSGIVFGRCQTPDCAPVGLVPSPVPLFHGHMVNLETGRASDGFWGPPDGPEAKAAALEVRAPSSASGTLVQGKSSGARRGSGRESWRPWRYDVAAEAIKRAVALHVAALGEDFLPYSSGGKPVRVKVHGMLSAAIKSRDIDNEEEAARAQRTYEGFMNLTLFASLFRLRMGKSEVQGHGLFATRAIAAQEVVTEFKGDLIGAAEAQQRVGHYSDMGFLDA